MNSWTTAGLYNVSFDAAGRILSVTRVGNGSSYVVITPVGFCDGNVIAKNINVESDAHYAVSKDAKFYDCSNNTVAAATAGDVAGNNAVVVLDSSNVVTAVYFASTTTTISPINPLFPVNP